MVRIAIVLAVLAMLLAGCGRDPDERFTLKTPPEHSYAAPLPSITRAAFRTTVPVPFVGIVGA